MNSLLKEIKIAATLSRLDRLLYLWSDWMRSGGSIARGYPKKSIGFVGSGKNSSEDFGDELDISNATIMDTIINDLPETERAAIQHKYLGSRYFYNDNGFEYVKTLRTAMLIIENAADKRGIL